MRTFLEKSALFSKILRKLCIFLKMSYFFSTWANYSPMLRKNAHFEKNTYFSSKFRRKGQIFLKKSHDFVIALIWWSVSNLFIPSQYFKRSTKGVRRFFMTFEGGPQICRNLKSEIVCHPSICYWLLTKFFTQMLPILYKKYLQKYTQCSLNNISEHIRQICFFFILGGVADPS